MESFPRYLVIPERGKKDIHQLLLLSEEQLHKIAEILRSKDTLKRKEQSYRLIANDINVTNEQALNILSAVTNILLQRRRYELSDEQLINDLKSLFPEEIERMKDGIQSALLDLLSESEEGYFVEKAERLKFGYSPHIMSVSSICDARPVFDKDRKTISGILLIASLGITTHDENHVDKTIFLQMTREDIQKIQICLEETDRKLAIMQQEFSEKKFDIL